MINSNTVIPLSPAKDKYNLFNDTPKRGNSLTHDAVGVMMFMYEKSLDKESDMAHLYNAMTTKFEVKNLKQLSELVSFYPIFDTDDLDCNYPVCFKDWKMFAYPYSKEQHQYPMPEAREAIMSEIRPWNNILGFSYYNVYKYLGWDELFHQVAFTESESANKQKYRFILVTDHESWEPAYTVFNKVLAGWLINNETKTITMFNNHQAIIIWTWLHSICQRFVDVWKLGQHKQHEDSYDEYYRQVTAERVDGVNEYVKCFNNRCAYIESLYDTTDFVEGATDLIQNM